MVIETLSTIVPSWVASANPLRSILLGQKNTDRSQGQHVKADKGLSETDGGHLPNRTSVFLQLEQGLAKSPNQPAVISMHQQPDHLSELRSIASRDGSTQKSADSSSQDRKPFASLAPDVDSCANGDCFMISYLEMHAISQKLAAGMLASGVKPDSPMLMLIPNGAEYGFLLWTSIIMRLGLACDDLSIRDPTGFMELEDRLRSLKPSVVVVEDGATAEAVDAALTTLRLAQPVRICLDATDAPDGWKSLVELASATSAEPIDADAFLEDARNDDPDRISNVIYTSGTSGRPKGCPLRVKAITHILHAQSWLLDKDSCQRALQQGHPSKAIALSQTLQTWRAGGSVVMSGRGFSVADIMQAIRQHRASFIVLSPPLVHAVGQEIASRPLDVDCVRSIQVGGDAVTRGVLTKCSALFPQAKIFVNHGMTEGGRSFIWPFFDSDVGDIPFFGGQMCPVGKAAPGSTVRVWDADADRPSKRGQPGQLHLSSASIIKHYLGRASESSFVEDDTGRWFNTGDIAIMDSDGVVFILGRAKDVIKRGGMSILPAPLESCIEEYTGKAVSVVPVPDPSLGHDVFAVISDFDGVLPHDIANHIIKTFGKQYTLGGLLCLKQIGLDEFPVNATHKIMKAEVQKAVMQYLQGQVQNGLSN